MIHEFDSDLARGKRWERELDEFFVREYGYQIRPATKEEEHRGIDRWFKNAKENFSVEYKGDERAGTTGNAFPETGHLGPDYAKRGWVYYTEASWIVYYIVGQGKAYILRPATLRKVIDEWIAAYQVKVARNKHYWTYGVVVPLSVFERQAELTLDIQRAAA